MNYIILIALCSLTYMFECTAAEVTPPSNNYTVTQQGITCVVLNAGLKLTIPYTAGFKNVTTTVDIPGQPFFNGSCNEDVDNLNIYFNDTWSLSFSFVNLSTSSFAMKSVSLTYVMTTKSFPNISTSDAGTQKSLTTILPNSTNTGPAAGSFKCSGESTLSLNNGISLHLYDLQYTAFGKTNSTWFSANNVQNCLQTSPAPDINTAAAVAVGIALGAMIVVVVVLYLIISKARGL